jgi:prolyl-tRNA editing enzyme YbaK/EbsC (Cys-tRNA(Pro) deacylase)
VVLIVWTPTSSLNSCRPERLQRADPEFVRQHTGQSIGGVGPIGHPTRLRTIVDVDLTGYPVVWAAAGHPHAVFATTFDELVRITGGTPAQVAAAVPVDPMRQSAG